MGGGATMRAVSKVVGIGVVNTGIRGRFPEHPVSAATRAFGRPVAAIGTASVADSVKPVVEPIDDTSVQKTVSGFEDWFFADDVDDIVVVSGSDDNVVPRVVFGGVPTLDEAKEATSELKEVLEKAYLSSPVSPRFGYTGQDSSLTCLQNSEAQHWESFLTTDTAAPTHAVQAFNFLNESPAVQAVVASIASDPNVWNSVLNNPDLQHFLQSQNMELSVEHMNPYVEESIVDDYSHADKSSGTDESAPHKEDPNGQEFNLEDELLNYWNDTKVVVVDMVNNLSDFFQNLFGGGHSAEKVSADSGFFEKALGPSLMGLVIMVIMVVVMKRPS